MQQPKVVASASPQEIEMFASLWLLNNNYNDDSDNQPHKNVTISNYD